MGLKLTWRDQKPGGCFTNVSRALQINLPRLYNASYHIYGENFKTKLCTYAQSHPLGAHDVQSFSLKFSRNKQIFWKYILESSRNVNNNLSLSSILCIYSVTPPLRPPNMVSWGSGKINVICKELCMKMDQILQPKWDIPSLSGFHCNLKTRTSHHAKACCVVLQVKNEYVIKRPDAYFNNKIYLLKSQHGYVTVDIHLSA